MLLETLRDMLGRFAAQPVAHDSSMFKRHKVSDDWSGNGFDIKVNGWFDDYTVLIYPRSNPTCAGNTSWLGVLVDKTADKVTSVTLRVAAYNAGMVYEYKFNFDADPQKGQRPLEMRQGPGNSVTGHLTLKRARCIDLVVLDLIEQRLPPQILMYRERDLTSWGVKDKPCIICQTPIPNNFHVCNRCRPASNR